MRVWSRERDYAVVEGGVSEELRNGPHCGLVSLEDPIRVYEVYLLSHDRFGGFAAQTRPSSFSALGFWILFALGCRSLSVHVRTVLRSVPDYSSTLHT